MPTPEELAARVVALEARLAEVEAVQAIEKLKARYGELVDGRYGSEGPKSADEVGEIADEIVQLFSEDAVWDGGENLGVWTGRDAIRKRFVDPTLQFTLHYFMNPRIEVEGDRAKARWDVLALITFQNGKPGWMTGVEDDEYVKVDGRWLHSRMKLSVTFMVSHERGWGKQARRP